MAIEMVYCAELDENQPRVFCDHCGGIIDYAHRAAFANAIVGDGERAVVRFFHLRPVANCLNEWESLHMDGERQAWEHLHRLPAFLDNNFADTPDVEVP